jgi:hypothetical protein
MPATATSAFTTAGATFAIKNAAPATYNSVGFAALAWILIGEVVDAGEFGRVYELVTHNPIGDRRTVKRKGSFNDGAITLQLARVSTNVGQAEIIAALPLDTKISFRIVLQDGNVFYFTGAVLSYTTNLGSVNQIVGATVQFEIDNDIIEA